MNTPYHLQGQRRTRAFSQYLDTIPREEKERITDQMNREVGRKDEAHALESAFEESLCGYVEPPAGKPFFRI